MRALVLHAPSGCYVQTVDGRTGDRNEAFDFAPMGQAIRLAELAGVFKMELVLVADHPSRSFGDRCERPG